MRVVDNLQGDKVIWMIVLILIMISILAISSSTPLLAIQSKSSRLAIIREQLVVVLIGMACIVGLYNFKWPDLLRKISKLGYILSLGLLTFLLAKVNLGVIKAVEINDAVRAISIFGFQLHVFEFTKVLMVMYLAWAVDAYKRDDLSLFNSLSKVEWLGFLARPNAKLFGYIFFPIISVCVLTLNGSTSSTLFIGGIMFITILIGGIKWKNLLPYAFVAIAVMGLCVGVYFASNGKFFGRVGTAIERISQVSENPEEALKKYPRNSEEFQKILDKNRQPISAKIAVSEGGIFGKGAGKSTQRYVVPIMFEDYMFSFIVEEYGLVGALLVVILYSSLLARGSLIMKNCNSIFEKTTIAGLVVLISGQAYMHMLINVDIGPLTGQTLPMISHGKSSFIAFSIAFGIILSISRVAKKRLDAIADNASLLAKTNDETRDRVTEVENLENE